VPRSSVIDLLLDYYQRRAVEVAFVQQRGYRRETWTYARILALAAHFAQIFDERQISKGDHVLLWGENSAEWVAAFLACMSRGIVAVPIDKVSAPEFVSRIAAQTRAKLLLHSASLMPPVGITAQPLEKTPAISARLESVELARADILQIIFTSGATAEPRGVVTTHGNVLANLEPFEPEIAKYRKYERIFHPIRFLDLVPLSHVFGQFMSIFIPPLIGGTVVFAPSVNPAEVIRQIKRERVSVLVAVPRMVESLQQKLEADDPDIAACFPRAEGKHFTRRWWIFRRIHRRFGWKFWAIVSGGASLDRAHEQFWERVGIVVLQGYGLTESTSLISVNHPFQRGRGTIGKVLPRRDLKLSDSGEILVRGENIASHYWQAGALQPVAGEDGWFHTGDLGELDGEGYLHFKGRQKTVIVTAEGMKVFPADLEGALKSQPEIKDVIVLGITRGGNAEACAVVLPARENADIAEAVRRANSHLASYQRILHHVLWPDADFPRTSTQKPRLDVLRSHAEAVITGRPRGEARGEIAELVAQISARPVTGDGELGLTSLERVELMAALEERYQLDLNEQTFAEIDSLHDLEQLVSRRASTGSQPAPASPEVSPAPATQPAATSRFTYPRWAQRWPITWIRPIVYHLIALPITYLFTMPRIEHRERIRNLRGPVLVVCNHVEYVDPGFVLAALPVRLRKLAIAMEGEMLEPMHHPPQTMNIVARLLEQAAYYLMTGLFNVFPLPKLSGYRQSFAFAGELADQGYSILVFPEGRRTHTGEIEYFRTGTGILAQGLRLPVVPMRIHGLWEAKQRGWRVVAPWRLIRVAVGDPLTPDPNASPESIAQELERRVRAL
jgi:long-chain acyl-CoA synthetase